MKVFKLLNVHDGNELGRDVSDRLYVESYPRSERIIAAFRNGGWSLVQMVRRTMPAIQQEGNYSFYLSGWDILFEKELAEGEEDDSEEILDRVQEEILLLDFE